ncbi:hypothetical protein SAMN05216392_1725 [Streptococcus equinus]|uniref:Uncharacterized protein n=1 Tax=Streptococcus equinus TaxID=1335 RepID=A0A1H1AWS8_STREI|nr:hypothetical protein SAMN05216392_1725 [Streptococcus equinus]
MTSYFESVLERHYQNFIFTYKMYAYSSKLVECLYHDALEEIKHLVKQFQKAGYTYSELHFYSRLYSRKIKHFYFSRVSLSH